MKDINYGIWKSKLITNVHFFQKSVQIVGGPKPPHNRFVYISIIKRHVVSYTRVNLYNSEIRKGSDEHGSMLDFEYVDSWELSSTKADLLVRGRIRPSLVAQGRPPDQTQGSNLTQQSALPPGYLTSVAIPCEC